MSKKLTITVFSLFLIFILGGCTNSTVKENKNILRDQLSIEDKIADFESMFLTILENYPYLEVNKRKNGIDWVANKEKYLTMIQNTKNDREYYETLERILKDLNNWHTRMMKREEVISYLEIYSPVKNYQEDWRNLNFQTLNNALALRRYEIDLNLIGKQEKSMEKSQRYQNAKVGDIIGKNIAYIYIPQMIIKEQRGNDEERINNYLEQVKNYKVLIIDIRGNGGGDSRYWQEYLVPKIIEKPIETELYLFLRGGKVFDKIKEYELQYAPTAMGDWREISSISRNDMKNLPEEIFKDFKYYVQDKEIISPQNNSIKFKGKIYLIVDKYVYSSSEGFAVFAKETKFATLIGEKTGGDGIGTDPWIEILPKSGYLYVFTKEMGTSSTGICNEENKTTPDIIIENAERNINSFSDKCILKVLEMENMLSKIK